MKPHEEQWAQLDADAGGWVSSHAGRGPVVATALGSSVEQMKARAALIAAAPDMARALTRMLGSGPCHNTGRSKIGCAEIQAAPPCQSCEARAALIKAGVLP